jgi:hypothetical protein
MDESSLYARRLSWEEARTFENAEVGFFPVGDAESILQSMRVVSVTERPHAPGGRQFNIVFRGPRAPLLPQMTYRVRHPQLGDYAFLVTPIRQSADTTDYEACFAHVA